MECVECSWLQVLVGIVAGAIIASIIAYLFKHSWIPEPEQILNRNTKFTRQKLIGHLYEVNYWKNSIFTMLEKIDNFDHSKDGAYQLTENQWDQMDYAKKRIIGELENIENLRKISGTILLEEYIAIQKYMASLNSFIVYSGNMRYHITFVLKELEFARYYAKEIIELIDNKYLIDFNIHWQASFNTVGGISKIHKPELEPGDIVSIHHDFQDELFYIDTQYSKMMTKLLKIDRDMDLLCEKLL